MKISQQSKIKKNEVKKKLVPKPKKENVMIIAQELKFARLLASNEKKTRDRALKTLKKWLLQCFDKGYEFKGNDFTRIWKGLFYAVWMSDKPLIQEELCDNISGILDLFPVEQYTHALSFFNAGLKAMAREWYGIDFHRMDKSLMLVRRYLRGSLRVVGRCGWSEDACKKYASTLTKKDGILAPETPMYAKNATSMILHFIDCFLEEVAKVSEGKIPEASLAELLRPFISYMCVGEVSTTCMACRRLLTALLRQSDVGIQYRHKTRAWQQMGCPEGGPDALELVMDEDGDEQQSEEEEESGETPLDPRAGRVDVILPSLPTPCVEIVKMLREQLANAMPKAHKRAKICIKRFTEASKSTYPLKVTPPPSVPAPPRAGPAAVSLLKAEKALVASADELALRGLSRKHRKRLLQKSRAGISIIDDVASLNNKEKHNNAAGDWIVEETEPAPKKKKGDTSNKENIKKKKEKKVTQNGDTAPKKLKPKKEPENTKKEIEKGNKKVCPAEQKTVKGAEKKKTVKKNSKASLVVKKAKSMTLKSAPSLKETKKIDDSLMHTPKKVKFVLKNNSMQAPFDYYKSVQESPNIPFDSKRKPSKANLKPSTPSPINPFFKKKWKLN